MSLDEPDPILPVYSRYKDFTNLNFPSDLDEAFSTNVGATWKGERNSGFDLMCGGRVKKRLT